MGGCNHLGPWKPSNNNGQPLKDFTEKKEEFRLTLLRSLQPLCRKWKEGNGQDGSMERKLADNYSDPCIHG